MKKIKTYPLVELVAGSYSGVVDILQTTSAKTFLIQVDNCYQQAKQRQETLEKELEAIKIIRGNCVSLWLHSLKFLKEESLCYQNSNRIIHVKRLTEDKIDYNTFQIHQFKK